MAREQQEKGFAERGSNVLKKIHYGLGATALVAAELIPPAAAALFTFAAWEGAHGLFWGWAEKHTAKKPDKG